MIYNAREIVGAGACWHCGTEQLMRYSGGVIYCTKCGRECGISRGDGMADFYGREKYERVNKGHKSLNKH